MDKTPIEKRITRLKFNKGKIKNQKQFWNFLFSMAKHSNEYFHRVLIQPERNLIKMHPFFMRFAFGKGHSVGSCSPAKWNSHDFEDTIIIQKNKKKTYFTKEEWKDIIEYINYINYINDYPFKHLIFCVDYIPEKDLYDIYEYLIKKPEDERNEVWYEVFKEGVYEEFKNWYNTYKQVHIYDKELSYIEDCGLNLENKEDFILIEQVDVLNEEKQRYIPEPKERNMRGYKFSLPTFGIQPIPNKFKDIENKISNEIKPIEYIPIGNKKAVEKLKNFANKCNNFIKKLCNFN